MWEIALPLVKGIARKIVGKVLKGRVEEDKIEEIVKAVDNVAENDSEIQADVAEWFNFNLEYFGKMENLPRAVQVVRACVRPTIGVSFTAMVGWGFFTGKIDGAQILQLTTAVVAFYFCERALLKPKPR